MQSRQYAARQKVRYLWRADARGRRRLHTPFMGVKRQAIAVLRGNPYKSVHKEKENAGSRKACGGIFLKLTEKIFASTNIFS